jgi:hypothetical protein
MLRKACYMAVALMTTWSSSYSVELKPKPDPAEDANSCTPQPQCRAIYTDLKPAKEHPGLKAIDQFNEGLRNIQ